MYFIYVDHKLSTPRSMLLLSILLLLLASYFVNVHGLTAHHPRPPLLATVAFPRQNFVVKQQCWDDNAASSSTKLCSITSMGVNSNNARWRTKIMDVARGGGGGENEEKSDDEYDYNDASDNDETDVEDTNENEVVVIDERMENSISGGSTTPDNATTSSSSNNFGLVVALWSSLVFDTILNKSKRSVLFPKILSSTTTTTTTTTLVATAQLSSGFALAVGVAFLLWRDMENRIESSGDSFLSLSSSDIVSSINKEEEETVARRMRIRLLLHLTIFGLLCLTGQSMGYYFSNHAPFLGLSAAAVNIHNVLTCISALMKEVKQGGGGTTTWNIRQLFKISSKDGRRNIAHRSRLEWTPFLFRLGTVTACVRCLVVGKDIIALTMGLLSSVAVAGIESSTTTIVSNARLLSLQVATLARLTLFAGVTNVLNTVTTASSTVKDKDYFRHHPFFATLSGILGLGCLGVGGMIMLAFLLLSSSSVSVNAIIFNQPEVLGGVLLMLFGTFASWNSVLGIKRHLRSV